MNIVVGYDGSESARRALRHAARLNRNGDPVTVVSSVPLSVSTVRAGWAAEEPRIEERERQLADAERVLTSVGVEARPVQAFGDAADAILAEARETGADMIVVGSSGKNLVERLLYGSVSDEVVHHAPCDVLVVR